MTLRRVVILFLIIFLPSAALLGGILALYYHQDIQSKKNILGIEEIQRVSHQK